MMGYMIKAGGTELATETQRANLAFKLLAQLISLSYLNPVPGENSIQKYWAVTKAKSDETNAARAKRIHA